MNGIQGYIYQSVKDALKDVKLPLEYRNILMQTGRLVFAEDDKYNKIYAAYVRSQEDPDKIQNQQEELDKQVQAVFGGSTLLKKATPAPTQAIKENNGKKKEN
jgi:hypothetical protein